MVEKTELERLKATPIGGVALRLGLRPKHGVCQCPFHNERNGSFRLNARTNSYICYGCGARGDVVALVQGVMNCDFLTAVHWLAHESGVILTDYKPEPTPRPVRAFDPRQYERCFEHPKLCYEAERFLYDERRLSPDVVRDCRLTSWRDREGVPG